MPLHPSPTLHSRLQYILLYALDACWFFMLCQLSIPVLLRTLELHSDARFSAFQSPLVPSIHFRYDIFYALSLLLSLHSVKKSHRSNLSTHVRFFTTVCFCCIYGYKRFSVKTLMQTPSDTSLMIVGIDPAQILTSFYYGS